MPFVRRLKKFGNSWTQLVDVNSHYSTYSRTPTRPFTKIVLTRTSTLPPDQAWRPVARGPIRLPHPRRAAPGWKASRLRWKSSDECLHCPTHLQITSTSMELCARLQRLLKQAARRWHRRAACSKESPQEIEAAC